MTIVAQVRMQDRIKIVLDTAVEAAYRFLDDSKLPDVTKRLVRVGAKELVKRLYPYIDQMSEDEIRTQIAFVTGQILPFILGDENTDQR